MTTEQSENFLLKCEERHGIHGRLSFIKGQGGLVYAEITNTSATAHIFLQGAHLTHYQPQDEQPVIWLSSKSHFKKGKSIRGGIPICWPWFGDNQDDPEKPAHGFARTSLWQVAETGERDSATFIRLFLVDDEKSRSLWPYPFRLELTVTVGENIIMTLTAHNTGKQPFVCTGALHTYFAVSDVSLLEITGLNDCNYLDKVEKFKQKHQCGPVRFRGETDRIYLDTAGECVINDPLMKRNICIDKKGSNTTVVWNPGPDKAAMMADMADEEHKQMVCVETANAADDKITVLSGESHILQTAISVKAI